MMWSSKFFRSAELCLVVALAGATVLNQGCRSDSYGREGASIRSAVSPIAEPADPAPEGMTWEIFDVWEGVEDSADDGKWHLSEPEEVDTSGYIDTTDGRDAVILASGEGVKQKEHYTKAFDNTESKWCIITPTLWIQYQYPAGARHRVTAYTLTSANDAPGRDPKKWNLLGSNDGKNWEILDTRSGEKFSARHQKRLFEVSSPGSYNCYKFDVMENHGEDTTQFAELELLIPKDAQ